MGLFFNNKLYRGNRCEKISSESFKAFDSPNLPPLVTMAVAITGIYWQDFAILNKYTLQQMPLVETY